MSLGGNSFSHSPFEKQERGWRIRVLVDIGDIKRGEVVTAIRDGGDMRVKRGAKEITLLINQWEFAERSRS